MNSSAASVAYWILPLVLGALTLIALAMVATSYVFRHVDPDRPARKVIHTALTDWRRTRESSVEQREPRLVASLLAGGSGAPAALTAPPSGLFLEKVYYKGDPRDAGPRPATPLRT